jgi:class 3 adenylate cyclase
METLVFVNHFISWMTAEALQNVPCIIDKYIGDEIMIVFSNEFGTKDHFAAALNAAKSFLEFDEWGFSPHIGIASGVVTVGYVGTPKMYSRVGRVERFL